MKKIIISIIMSFVVSVLSFASIASADHRYQQTKLLIKNHAPYPVLLTMDNVDGRWKIPVALKQPVLLNENQAYQNTVISIKKNDDMENFVSLDVAQVGNARENYLIFAESTSSKSQQVSSDIFDGIGPLFAKSGTNHCNNNTSTGHAYCELVIN